MWITEVNTLVEVRKGVEMSWYELNKVGSILALPTSWIFGEGVLLVLPVGEAKLIDIWTDFTVTLFLSTRSPAAFLLSAAPLFPFRSCLEVIRLAGETGSLDALLWVDNFKEESTCLLLLGEARISLLADFWSINKKVIDE